MYLEIFLADFAVFRVFWGISRDFAEMSEFRGSATARNIRSPEYFSVVKCPDVNHCFCIVLHIRKDSYPLTTTDPGNLEIGISESLISQKHGKCPPYTFKPFAV